MKGKKKMNGSRDIGLVNGRITITIAGTKEPFENMLIYDKGLNGIGEYRTSFDASRGYKAHEIGRENPDFVIASLGAVETIMEYNPELFVREKFGLAEEYIFGLLAIKSQGNKRIEAAQNSVKDAIFDHVLQAKHISPSIKNDGSISYGKYKGFVYYHSQSRYAMDNTRGDVMFFEPTTGKLVEHFTAEDKVNPFVYVGSNVTTLKDLLEEQLAAERAKNAQLQADNTDLQEALKFAGIAINAKAEANDKLQQQLEKARKENAQLREYLVSAGLINENGEITVPQNQTSRGSTSEMKQVLQSVQYRSAGEPVPPKRIIPAEGKSNSGIN